MPTSSTRPELLARAPAALRWVADQLAQANAIAMDTEFYRDDVYAPQLCLVQLATPTLLALVDPLQCGSLEPLAEILEAPERIWILHSAKGDLEVLERSGLPLPGGLFDTQLAAAFCGWPRHVSYAELAHDLCGVSLAKTATRTNWRRRPLSSAQLRYAAQDVGDLPAMTDALYSKLEDRGWLEAAEEECAALLDPSLWRVEPADAWLRIKAWRSLPSAALAVLQELAESRESLAIELDRPVRWLADDRCLVGWALRGGDKLEGAPFRRMSTQQIAYARDALHEAFARGQAQRNPRRGPEKPRLNSAERTLADTLLAELRTLATQAGIAPEMLATRRLAGRLLRARAGSLAELAEVPGWSGWRHDRFGTQAWQVLNG